MTTDDPFTRLTDLLATYWHQGGFIVCDPDVTEHEWYDQHAHPTLSGDDVLVAVPVAPYARWLAQRTAARALGAVEWITQAEAAEMAGVHVNTIARWADEDRIRSRQGGPTGGRLVAREDVTAERSQG